MISPLGWLYPGRMTKPILYDYYRSSACYRVRIALNLKQVDYAPVPINLVAGAQKDEVYRARNPQGFVFLSVRRQKDRGKHQVIRVLGIEGQRLLRVLVTLDRIAFGIPIDREVAIRQSQRILGDGLLHQGQSFFELAIVNRHLAEAVQRD